MRAIITVRTALCVAFSTALALQAAVAQDVQYKSVTKMDMGLLNFALRLSGGSEVGQTTYIKGKKMRSDMDKSSTIFDLERNRFITLNHDDKTYTSIPFAQMTAAFSDIASSTGTRAEKGKMKATARDSAGNTADFTFNVKFEPTSERESVNGQDAQRAFATIETDMKVTPEGESKSSDVGTLVVLVDTWNANAGPAYTAVRAFQQSMSKELRDQAFAGAKGLSAAFAQDPRMGEAMKRAAAEQRKMDGIAMKTTMHFVVVPPTVKFDRNVAIKPPEEDRGGGVAKRALGGLFGGALGRKAQEEKPESGQTKQSTLMKVTTEIEDVQTTTLPASLFEIPAGYREIPFAPPTRSPRSP